MKHSNLNAYEGVESLTKFSDGEFEHGCNDKLASVEKLINFIKQHVIPRIPIRLYLALKSCLKSCAVSI